MYKLIKFPYDYRVEMTNRVKGLVLKDHLTHKLKSRFPGKITKTSDMEMIPL